jgi:hypothetical protein
MPRLALTLCLLCVGCGERPAPGSDLRDRVADLKRALADAGSWRTWQAQLEARIAAAGRESWAGEYKGGAENSVDGLWYAPGVGFEWALFADAGEGVAWGTAEMVDGRVHLEPVGRLGERMPAREWIAVRWGARRYLLPSGRGVQGFCNAFARGTEPRANELGPVALRSGQPPD